jgi:hypothetical protein
MALVEDILKGNLLPAAAVGAVVLVLPKVFPKLPAPLRSALKGGISLFLESEAEAEGGIVNRLAQNALKNTLKELSGPGPAEDRKEAAQSVVESFKQTARTRAKRYGYDHDDHSARYRRHIVAFRRAVEQKQSQGKGAHDRALSEILSKLDHAEPSAG